MSVECTIDRPVLLSEVGASSVRGSTIGDRERAAQRLLRAVRDVIAAEKAGSR
ncbi:hypothetical protein [Mycolicibacterium komossense]|uniref:Uncharacterized protein n=1 Tax=Mycolicibacterium komossense TaxID=1779 RepID=A0ABT3CFS6_9MYCO|nr:hypothetical protein [Mycolicibacterium komossense]MCV7228359.1 hypothetical protein [Mycolicibacterium komossense]